jgi:hypothetical protein
MCGEQDDQRLYSKDIFKGIKLHLSSRVIAWLPAPVGTKQINTTSKQAT